MNCATKEFAGRSYSSDGDAIGHRQRFALVMGYIDRGDPEILVQMFDLDLHLLAQLLVERTERLVHQHELGLEHERARERYALLLPSGKLCGPPICETR